MQISHSLLHLLSSGGDEDATATIKMMNEDMISPVEFNVIFTRRPWEMYYLEQVEEVLVPLTPMPLHHPTLLGLPAMQYPTPHIIIQDNDGTIDEEE